MNVKNLSDEMSDSVTRRQFLKTAAVGSLGSLILQQQAFSAEPNQSQKTVSLIGLVDIAQTLADRDVTKNTYWIDNNRLGGSSHEGSNSLVTRVKNGDVVKWVVIGLEVETSIYIGKIHGSISAIANPSKDKDSLLGGWIATVDTTKTGVFSYTVDFMVEGIHMPMLSTPALEIV